MKNHLPASGFTRIEPMMIVAMTAYRPLLQPPSITLSAVTVTNIGHIAT